VSSKAAVSLADEGQFSAKNVIWFEQYIGLMVKVKRHAGQIYSITINIETGHHKYRLRKMLLPAPFN